MKRLGVVVLAWVLDAQSDLPKDVIQLAQIRREVGKSLVALDNYTCLETIERASRKNARQSFQHVDTVTVEVTVVHGRELYSPDTGKIAAGGFLSTGSFTAAVRAVLIHNASTIRPHGMEEILGRQAIRWDYSIPYNLSGWDVEIDGHSARVSEAGSFWADAGTLDLLRLEISAQDIPPGLGAAAITERLDFSRVRVRSEDLLLPKIVETSVAKLNGEESRNRIEFSGCREFHAESKIAY